MIGIVYVIALDTPERRTKDDVEKTMEGFFNGLLVQRFNTLIQAADC